MAAVDTLEAWNLLLSIVDPELAGLHAEVTFSREDVRVARIADLARRDQAVEQKLFRLCNTELAAGQA